MNGIEKTTDSDGTIRWKKDGLLHRNDGPALENKSLKEWYIDGALYRESGPAIEYADGAKYWFLHGVIHRDDGPAVVFANGTREWWQNGSLHRLHAPAIIYPDGTEEWWVGGEHLKADEVKTLTDFFTKRALRQAAGLIAPFKGTLNAVAAPEKASFAKQKRPRVAAAPLSQL